MNKAKIIGTGLYAPGEAINNDELKSLARIEFDSAKVESKLGIKTRHIAKLRGLSETTADFATKAAEQALANAGISASQVGLFIVGTDTPEYISPSTALIVQGRLQGGEVWGGAFDVNASCASFTTAFDTAARIVAHDPKVEYAVVVGVYNMPAFVRDQDAFGYSIFADGAGAVVLKKTDLSDSSGYVEGQLLADGTQWNYIGIYHGGTKNPITHEKLEKGEFGLELLQPLPGDRNVRLWPMVAEKLLNKAGMSIADVDHFIFTQINRSVIEKVMDVLALPHGKTTFIMDQYGYTGSGCIPMAMHAAIQKGTIKKGDLVMWVASGAGLAVGANLVRY